LLALFALISMAVADNEEKEEQSEENNAVYDNSTTLQEKNEEEETTSVIQIRENNKMTYIPSVMSIGSRY
jgi:hypothetical protein